jgi:hypothetical protein
MYKIIYSRDLENLLQLELFFKKSEGRIAPAQALT